MQFPIITISFQFEFFIQGKVHNLKTDLHPNTYRKLTALLILITPYFIWHSSYEFCLFAVFASFFQSPIEISPYVFAENIQILINLCLSLLYGITIIILTGIVSHNHDINHHNIVTDIPLASKNILYSIQHDIIYVCISNRLIKRLHFQNSKLLDRSLKRRRPLCRCFLNFFKVVDLTCHSLWLEFYFNYWIWVNYC